jgi:mono/diheme cytochrome c family protein
MPGAVPPVLPRALRGPPRRGPAPSPRPSRSRASLALVVAATALAGCGGSGHQPAPRSGLGAAPVAEGPRIFASACASCHTLTGADAGRKPGGDLAGFRLSERLMISFARIMPANPRLSGAQIRAVSAYVVAVENRYAHRHR